MLVILIQKLFVIIIISIIIILYINYLMNRMASGVVWLNRFIFFLHMAIVITV